MKSFFPDAISSWNIFTNHFLTDALKTHIASLHPKTKSCFSIHDPLGSWILFQLIVTLSSLRIHKKRSNFIDTPKSAVVLTAWENTSHFLFVCQSRLTYMGMIKWVTPEIKPFYNQLKNTLRILDVSSPTPCFKLPHQPLFRVSIFMQLVFFNLCMLVLVFASF